MLATYSLLPIVRAFAASSGIGVELKDISVAGRILCQVTPNICRQHAALFVLQSRSGSTAEAGC